MLLNFLKFTSIRGNPLNVGETTLKDEKLHLNKGRLNVVKKMSRKMQASVLPLGYHAVLGAASVTAASIDQTTLLSSHPLHPLFPTFTPFPPHHDLCLSVSFYLSLYLALSLEYHEFYYFPLSHALASSLSFTLFLDSSSRTLEASKTGATTPLLASSQQETPARALTHLAAFPSLHWGSA